MTTWIIEAANAGFAAQERSAGGSVVWGREREDGVKLRVRVREVGGAAVDAGGDGGASSVECFPGGIVFVTGELVDERSNTSKSGSVRHEDSLVGLLLAGVGGARGKTGVKLSKGVLLGIRAPAWEIDIAGEMWTVGVDWMLL